MTIGTADIARARKHLGYTAAQPVQGFVAGFPYTDRHQFLFESSIQRIIPANEPDVIRMLNTLDRIDCALEGVAFAGAPAESVEDMTLNLQEPEWLEKRYRYWAFRLAEMLGCPVCPWAERFKNTGGVTNVRILR